MDSFRINWIPRRIFAKDTYLSKWLLSSIAAFIHLDNPLNSLNHRFVSFYFVVLFFLFYFPFRFRNKLLRRLLHSNYYCYYCHANFIAHDQIKGFNLNFIKMEGFNIMLNAWGYTFIFLLYRHLYLVQWDPRLIYISKHLKVRNKVQYFPQSFSIGLNS